jgi:hypothetical protein
MRDMTLSNDCNIEGHAITRMSQNISGRIKGRLAVGRLCASPSVLSFVTSIRFISPLEHPRVLFTSVILFPSHS